MISSCQWMGPDQDPLRDHVRHCGHSVLWPGRSYCEQHVWLVYQRGTAIGQNRKNQTIERELAELKRLEELDHD